MPKEVWYYVIIPIIILLLFYGIFTLIYNRKKGTYYYDYVVDYVYSSCGIIFCGLLFCLLFGYAIATFHILIVNNLLNQYILLAIIIAILPLIPSCFLVYIIKIYINNLKRKEKLDQKLNEEELSKRNNEKEK